MADGWRRWLVAGAAVSLTVTMAACGSSSSGPKITAGNFCSQLQTAGQNLNTHLGASTISQSALKGDVKLLDSLARAGPSELKGPLGRVAGAVNGLATQATAPGKADIQRINGDRSLRTATGAVNNYGQSHCKPGG